MWWSKLLTEKKIRVETVNEALEKVRSLVPKVRKEGSVGHWFFFEGDYLMDYNVIAEAIPSRNGKHWWLRIDERFSTERSGDRTRIA